VQPFGGYADVEVACFEFLYAYLSQNRFRFGGCGNYPNAIFALASALQWPLATKRQRKINTGLGPEHGGSKALHVLPGNYRNEKFRQLLVFGKLGKEYRQ